MNIQVVVESELVRDPSSVWLLKGHDRFSYSDGLRSERYLERVLRLTKDLGTQSLELESHIKDWASEYHLSRKRAQLLSGFRFDRNMKVLEVGCGCGAITRHLGENFDQVVSVEGSLSRAKLARLRTRDLDSVQIVCAPFQNVRFRAKFDIIFCIGVYEYSESFVDGEDPHSSVVKYFSELLAPGGIVVIAIENQFGLKYFCSSTEDHLGTMFEGIEGYHRRPGKVRTFGRYELEADLKRFFSNVRFYYPYPDYKLPDCVIAEDFLATGMPGELVSQFQSRDYSGERGPLWDETSTVLELARNKALQFFSNSFLVLARNGDLQSGCFDQHAVMFSPTRRHPFATVTRVVGRLNETLVVRKQVAGGESSASTGPLLLRSTQSEWAGGMSLQTQIAMRARALVRPLAEIFEPCRLWLTSLRDESSDVGGRRRLSGDHIDSIWSNSYVVSGRCRIVDREWVWHSEIPMNVIVIRAIFDFLEKMDRAPICSRALSVRSGRRLISSIATSIGVELGRSDFAEFISLEAEFQHLVFGLERRRSRTYLEWYLADRSTLHAARRAKQLWLQIRNSVSARLSDDR